MAWQDMGSSQLRLYMTDTMDLTQTGPFQISPNMSGAIYVQSKIGYMIASVAGTPGTALTCSFGDNVGSSYVNVIASAAFIATAAMVASNVVNVSGLATAQTRTPGVGLFVNITVGAAGSGGFALTGRFWSIGAYVPAT